MFLRFAGMQSLPEEANPFLDSISAGKMLVAVGRRREYLKGILGIDHVHGHGRDHLSLIHI